MGRTMDEQGVSYHFLRFERPNKEPFEVEFADGPKQGTHVCSQPPHSHRKDVLVPLTEKGSVFNGDGEPSAVAVYSSKLSGGKWRFHLDRIEESGEVIERARAQINERRAIQAINRFYLSPNDSIYSKPPTDEHPQVLIEAGIDSECESKKLKIRNPDSGETIEIDAANVLFSSEEISRIAAFISSSPG